MSANKLKVKEDNGKIYFPESAPMIDWTSGESLTSGTDYTITKDGYLALMIAAQQATLVITDKSNNDTTLKIGTIVSQNDSGISDGSMIFIKADYVSKINVTCATMVAKFYPLLH